jgi:hypothetical protein
MILRILLVTDAWEPQVNGVAWLAATEQFFAHLHPRQRGAGVPAIA